MISCRMSSPIAAPAPFERRQHRRYALRLDVQYRFLNSRTIEGRTGSGRTLNISSHGLLFETDAPLPDRGEITLDVRWPFLLDNAHHLKFVVRGWIVRSEANATAVIFRSYEFHTRKRSVK